MIGRRRSISTVYGRFKEKSIVSGRLRKKKERRRGKEEEEEEKKKKKKKKKRRRSTSRRPSSDSARGVAHEPSPPAGFACRFFSPRAGRPSHHEGENSRR
ncbi:hypothetical protein BHE74_00016772, partial [Ensete ventricosum]